MEATQQTWNFDNIANPPTAQGTQPPQTTSQNETYAQDDTAVLSPIHIQHVTQSAQNEMDFPPTSTALPSPVDNQPVAASTPNDQVAAATQSEMVPSQASMGNPPPVEDEPVALPGDKLRNQPHRPSYGPSTSRIKPVSDSDNDGSPGPNTNQTPQAHRTTGFRAWFRDIFRRVHRSNQVPQPHGGDTNEGSGEASGGSQSAGFFTRLGKFCQPPDPRNPRGRSR